MKILNVTPLHIVDAIEPALPFWTERLGYTVVASVPHEDAIGFALLVRDGSQIMLQTRKSVAADVPAMASERSALYVDVASLAEATAAVRGAEIVLPERTTFYGAKELWIRDPAGIVIGLSEHHRE